MKTFTHLVLALSLLTGCSSAPPKKADRVPGETRSCDACQAVVLDDETEFCPECLRRLGDKGKSKKKDKDQDKDEDEGVAKED
jgi:starvation-inducible outer membrane lipoprotein